MITRLRGGRRPQPRSGLFVTALIAASPLDPRQPDDLPERVAEFPEVEDCYSVAGETNYVLKVRTRTTTELEDLIRRLREKANVDDPHDDRAVDPVRAPPPAHLRLLSSCDRGERRCSEGGHVPVEPWDDDAMNHRLPALALTVAAATSFLAACGSPDYEYVRNTEARTAFKVPIEWTVFDEATMHGETTGPQRVDPRPGRVARGTRRRPVALTRARAQPRHGYDTDYPQGIAGVYRLSSNVRDAGQPRACSEPDPARSTRSATRWARRRCNVLAYDDRLDEGRLPGSALRGAGLDVGPRVRAG